MHNRKNPLTFALALNTKPITLIEGEMVERSITAVLKTAVPRGTGGSNPSLSAVSLDYQVVTKFTPNFTPENVKLGVFFILYLIIVS